MMTRMLSSGPGVGGRDDLGARLLAEHPRGEEWRQLDITVANLTLDQLIRMGGLVEPGDRRAAARAQLIEDIDYRKRPGTPETTASRHRPSAGV
jgi:hypothetical protein